MSIEHCCTSIWPKATCIAALLCKPLETAICMPECFTLGKRPDSAKHFVFCRWPTAGLKHASPAWQHERGACSYPICKQLLESAPAPEVLLVQDDAAEAQWFSVTEVPTMAFDHKLIVRTAFEKLLEQKDGQGKGKLPRCLYWLASKCRSSALCPLPASCLLLCTCCSLQ